MNETLSVIDEHITDMNTPRSSYTNKRDTLGSVYSTQALSRFSYIPGHETDEDEHQLHTEDEVMAWTPARVAEYLEDHGVERSHCDVFKDQEISGEVLLAMDQSSIFIKEFDLGPVGRRLKTWHKVKALQDEVKQSTGGAQQPVSELSAGDGLEDTESDVSRNRSSTVGTTMPRALSTRQSLDGAARSNTLQSMPSSASSLRQSAIVSPLQSMTSMSRAENTYRPSAQTIRTMNHARRHSSMDSTSDAGTTRSGHRKQPSFDKSWQPGAPAQANGKPGHAHATSVDSPPSFPKLESSVVVPSSPGELDRGYFSSNEVDNLSRGTKSNKLTKKPSTATTGIVSPLQSRANSFLSGAPRMSYLSGRASSTDNVRDPPVSPIVAASPSQHMHNAISAVQSKFGNTRSATSPALQSKPSVIAGDSTPHTVTKLDPAETPSLNAVAVTPTTIPGSESSSIQPTPSPSSTSLGVFGPEKPKVTGLRAISDAVTNKEKTTITPTLISKEDVSSPTRTGSTTPSTETRSFDLQKSDIHSRTSAGSGSRLAPPSASTRRSRPKTKKATSAYTRGLEKKAPKEQMEGCDYSGWMKKKSGSLMTTWKSRLFVLRGRRLSYYYRDDDTEEKGLIDISFHRVLPAHNETLTGLHAAVTGAAGSPTSPTHNATPTTAQLDLKQNPPVKGDGDDGLFIFKLVPPKSGLSKGVNFTKPTVHYFAVNSRREGRLWMAALMKATIDRDETGVVTTTYNQKTISLAKARARKERPPALKEDEVAGRAELEGDDASSKGVGLVELNEKNDSAVGGAEQENVALPTAEPITTLPVAPTTTESVLESPMLNDKEKEAVALNSSA